jgi:general secretion pathway protein C
MKRLPVLASFVLFVALCVSLAFWAMQLFKPAPRAVIAPPQVAAAAPDLAAAAGLFGGRSTVAVASNYQLKGVVAAVDGRDSVAIVSANGKPAQAIRQGAEIVPGAVVKEVHKGYVLVAEGGVPKRIELPQTAPPPSALASPAALAPAPAPAAVRPTPSSVPPGQGTASPATLGGVPPIQQSFPAGNTSTPPPAPPPGNPGAAPAVR